MQARHSAFAQILERAEGLWLFLLYAVLLAVDTGYVARLERLPVFPPSHPPVGFLSLPRSYESPRVEVKLLLTVAAGMIAWSGLGLLRLVRKKSEYERSAALTRLRTTLFHVLVTGADLLSIQFCRS